MDDNLDKVTAGETSTLVGKRKLNEDFMKEEENEPKVSKRDETIEANRGTNDRTEIVNISESNKISSVSFDESTEKTDISKVDDLPSAENVKSYPASEYGSVLRSQRPLHLMGMYNRYELHGIIPENVVAAFKREKSLTLRKIKKESKSKDKSDLKEKNNLSNKIFNELIENHCRQNGIDPLTLLENGREKLKLFRENRDNRIDNITLDLHKYPRSQVPIDLMKMYSRAELKWACPKKFTADCEHKRLAWYRQKVDELTDKTPITERRVSCESLKYFNEMIETYCTQHDIDLKSFIEDKNNRMDKKTIRSHQNNDKPKYSSSSASAANSTSFTGNFSHDFTSDSQADGFMSFEGSSGQTSKNLDMPSTSNANCHELDTKPLISQQTMNQAINTNLNSDKVLRSQRPLEIMTFYQLEELSGIVPESVIVAFQYEQRKFLEKNLKKELKKASKGAEKKIARRKMVQIANRLFNELIEQYCVENNIDPMKLLENESEIDPKKHPNGRMQLAKDVHVGSGIDWNRLPRSKEPLHFMQLYRDLEMKDTIPIDVFKDCQRKREKFKQDQKKAVQKHNPITTHKILCETYKYFNELIEEYCQQNNIDMNQMISNREKSLAEKRKHVFDKRQQKRKGKKQPVANESLEGYDGFQGYNETNEDFGENERFDEDDSFAFESEAYSSDRFSNFY